MEAGLSISVRLARPEDAPDIGAVHVAAWRSAYAGILSEATLTGMSVLRQGVYYETMIRRHGGVFVAVAGSPEQVIGFASIGRERRSALHEGEIHTLYVLDDWREAGVGRQLMQAAASTLAADGCQSAFLWVLADNPSRWFYHHLGGRATATGSTRVGGESVAQTRYAWDPIKTLIDSTSSQS